MAMIPIRHSLLTKVFLNLRGFLFDRAIRKQASIPKSDECHCVLFNDRVRHGVNRLYCVFTIIRGTLKSVQHFLGKMKNAG